ncbi:MAG TPA: FAD-dependent oxidoreductase, partial [Kofleriaceae bacterium]|nr:FAD-dependent oxidoreductase [Kofleriaceae bacterium]
ATVLAEAGARVTLLEREAYLGGRAGSWPDRLATGEPFEMERGFHGFFRQYYNLRRLLRRVDPDLSALAPAGDYPILAPGGRAESFSGLPRRAPWNAAALAWRSPALRARDLLGVQLGPALEMLRFDMEATYRRWDGRSARDYLDALGFPPAARRMLFDVFAHSFFCAEEEMSAGELLMMFHWYFLGNREGLVFDLAASPMSRALWHPLGERLERLGAAVETGVAASSLRRAGGGWTLEREDGRALAADAVVLALSVPALRALVAASPDLAGRWADDIAALPVTRPFAVLRLWLDRPVLPGRAPFAGTTGFGRLDNISVYDHFQDESRAWAASRGGSVVELHAYAVEPDADPRALRAELIAGLEACYPETRAARAIDERWLWRQDCAGFPPGAHARRPGVTTPHPGLTLAGDFVRLPVPSALMERAATSGIMAANHILSGTARAPEPIATLPARGLLALPRPLARARRRAAAL